MRYAPHVLALLVGAPLAQSVHHVDALALGADDGSSWADAYVHLQDALAAALPGDQVWVAAGTYRADLGAGMTTGDRTASFELTSGVEVYGGFQGTETALAQRAGLFEQTLLSGDLLGDDVGGGKTDNSLHVAVAFGVDATARLDGFRIVGGYAVTQDTWGAGLFLNGASPTLANLLFEDNRVSGSGGGLYSSSGSPRLVDCTFRGNIAGRDAQGGFVTGGAAWLSGGTPWFERCRFEDNVGEVADTGGVVEGGGLHLAVSAATFVDCVFSGNVAQVGSGPGSAKGGAVYAEGPEPARFVRCTFAGNRALAQGSARGGALFLQGSSPRLDACELVDNRAEGAIGEGGAIALAGPAAPVLAQCVLSGGFASSSGGGVAASAEGAPPRLVHCAVVGNDVGPGGLGAGLAFSDGSYDVVGSVLFHNGAGAEADQLVGGAPAVERSCVEGWTGLLGGVGNHGQDPLFADTVGPDALPFSGDEDLSLGVGSPCRDAADAAALPADTADLDADGDVVEPLPLDLAGAPRAANVLALDAVAGAGPQPDMGPLEASPGILTADVEAVSLGLGGAQALTLTAGAAFAGDTYLVLGSVAGTTPGLVADGHVIALNPADPYFDHTVVSPNVPPLTGSLGTLDGQGRGACTFTVPPVSNPAFEGLVVHHAFVVLRVTPAPQVVLASDPAPVLLAP